MPPLTSLTATARCHGCDWTAEGKPAEVDKAADKHTGAGHPTATEAVPEGGSISGDAP